MLGEELSRALGDISDDKIMAAAQLAPRQTRRIWPRLVAAAAAIIFLLLGTMLLTDTPEENRNHRAYFSLYVYADETEGVELTPDGNTSAFSSSLKEAMESIDGSDFLSSGKDIPSVDPESNPQFCVVLWPSEGYSFVEGVENTERVYVTVRVDEQEQAVRLSRVYPWSEGSETAPSGGAANEDSGKSETAGYAIFGYSEVSFRMMILLHSEDGTLLQGYLLEIIPNHPEGYTVRIVDRIESDAEDLDIYS